MIFLNPEKLSVKIMRPAAFLSPVKLRRYTLTHSDTTGQLFLSIGLQFDPSAINAQMRDEVLAEWQMDQRGQYLMVGSVYVSGGEYTELQANRRFEIFHRKLRLALSAIFCGDQLLLACHPQLLDAPIYIYFESNFPQLRGTFYYGNPGSLLQMIHSE